MRQVVLFWQLHRFPLPVVEIVPVRITAVLEYDLIDKHSPSPDLLPFSLTDIESMQEYYVGVPEEGGSHLISQDHLPPGSVYTAVFTEEDTVALHRIEISRMSDSGKLRITGNPDRPMKESIVTAFDCIKANKSRLGIERDGVAFFVALYTLLRDKPVQAGLVVLGEMTIQGNILLVRSLVEPLQMIMDNGAKRVLIPAAQFT